MYLVAVYDYQIVTGLLLLRVMSSTSKMVYTIYRFEGKSIKISWYLTQDRYYHLEIHNYHACSISSQMPQNLN